MNYFQQLPSMRKERNTEFREVSIFITECLLKETGPQVQQPDPQHHGEQILRSSADAMFLK